MKQEQRECVLGGLLVYINEAYRGRYTIIWLIHKNTWAQTRLHKHTSIPAAVGQAAGRNSWKCQTPTCQCPSAVSAFLQRIYISEKDILIHSSSSCRTANLPRRSFCQSSTSSYFVAALFLLSVSCRKHQLLWSHMRRKHRTSTLSCTQWTSSGATDLLISRTTWDSEHNCFLSTMV